MGKDIRDIKLPKAEIKSHYKALGEALKKEQKERSSELAIQNNALGRGRRSLGMRLAISGSAILALVLAITLAAIFSGSPIGEKEAWARAQEWYTSQREGGRWQHSLIYVDTHLLDLGLGKPGIYLETWTDTENGEGKLVVRDPETCEVLETVVALRREPESIESESNEPPPMYRLYTSKPIFDEDNPPKDWSILERWMGGKYSGTMVSYADIRSTVVLLDGQYIDQYLPPAVWLLARRLAPPFMGYSLNGDLAPDILWEVYDVCACSTVEDLIERSEIVGEEEIEELGRRALVIQVKEGESYTDFRLPEVLAVENYLYIDKETFAYLGISTYCSQNGSWEWTDKALYEKYEYTDIGPGMDILGMREIEGPWLAER